jgi:hypothetical protein
MSFKKTCGSLRRGSFKTPLFKNNLGSFLFLNIAMFLIIFIKIIKIYLNLSIFVLRVQTLGFKV